MSNNYRNETLIEKEVTYTLEVDGKFFIIENVPARVGVETGERFFAPETVEVCKKSSGKISNQSE